MCGLIKVLVHFELLNALDILCSMESLHSKPYKPTMIDNAIHSKIYDYSCYINIYMESSF